MTDEQFAEWRKLQMATIDAIINIIDQLQKRVRDLENIRMGPASFGMSNDDLSNEMDLMYKRMRDLKKGGN